MKKADHYTLGDNKKRKHNSMSIFMKALGCPRVYRYTVTPTLTQALTTHHVHSLKVS